MARLSIRATGDRKARESTTTGTQTVESRVYVGNRHVGTTVTHDWSDRIAVYWYPQGPQPRGKARTLLYEECKGYHENPAAIIACKDCSQALDNM